MPLARASVVGGAMPAATAILEFTPTMRGLIENVIEDLILLLDEIDGDADLELTAEDDEEQHDAEQPAYPEYGRSFDEPWGGFLDRAEIAR